MKCALTLSMDTIVFVLSVLSVLSSLLFFYFEFIVKISVMVTKLNGVFIQYR